MLIANFGSDSWFKLRLVYYATADKEAIMKKEFKKWLIFLNCEGINSLGINEIVSRVDEELRIVRANEQERIVLEELIAAFNEYKKTAS